MGSGVLQISFGVSAEEENKSIRSTKEILELPLGTSGAPARFQMIKALGHFSATHVRICPRTILCTLEEA